MNRFTFSLLVCCVFSVVASGSRAAPVAVDPATQGPFTAVASEYQLPAKVDKEVTSALATELWARVFYPTGKGVPKLLPLVVMMHGEHGTCGHLDPTGKWYIDDNAKYTFDGTCPAGYRPTPNHLGYAYIGSLLASNGYLVVSINTNRGINQAPEVAAENDPGNIQRRGRMLLRHLQQLGIWNDKGGTPSSVGFEFKKRIDFQRITLVGHSRGAEAIASAIALYYDNGSPWPDRLPANTNFLGLAAMAPSDFQTSINPASTYGRPYSVLLPMCDGDVVRLAGIHYYDTAVGFALDGPGNFKSSFATWGTDHDAYNTEWQTQDSYDFATDQPNTQTCPGQGTLFPTLGTSAKQEQIGRRFVMALVRGVTESSNYAQLLNPAYDVPASIASITRFDRGYFPGQQLGHGMRLMQFVGGGKCKTELFVTEGTVGSCGRAPEHDQLLTWISRIRWGAPAGSTPTENNFAHFVFNGGSTFDLSNSKTIEFRMAPDCALAQPTSGSQTDYGCKKKSLQGDPSSEGSQNVFALLEDINHNDTSYVSLGEYTDSRQAVGINEVPINSSTLINPLFHAIMSSVRVPLADFQPQAPFDITKVASIWFFLGYQNSSGGLFVGDVMATDADSLSAAKRAARRAGTPPLPPRSLVLRAGHETTVANTPPTTTQLAPLAASPGNQVVAVRNTSWPNRGVTGKGSLPFVAVTVQTPRPMIEADSGYRALVGGSSVEARYVGSSPDRTTTTLLIARSALASAPAGVGLSITSGGSRWNFGALPATQ